MSTREKLIREIKEVPEPLLNEVLDFVYFLKAKIASEKLEATLSAVLL
jgi:hypothetical protein